MIGFHFTNPASGNIWQLIVQPSERVDAMLVGNTHDTFLKAVGYTENLTFRFIGGTYRDLATVALTPNSIKSAFVVEGRLRVADVLP